MTRWPSLENIFTMGFTVVLVLGMVRLGMGWLSLFGFVLLLNMNYTVIKNND